MTSIEAKFGTVGHLMEILSLTCRVQDVMSAGGLPGLR